jgi:GTP-binding protein EngB required for normal cell division
MEKLKVLSTEVQNNEKIREEMQQVRKELQAALQEMQPELRKLLKPKEMAEIEAEFKEIDELLERLSTGLVWVSLFGKTSVGKSAIANSLIGADVAEVGIQMDLTIKPGYYKKTPWMLVDVPGILGEKVNTETAIEEAFKAHGLIFVVDGEPYELELQLFKIVHEAVPNTPIIVFVNKWDKTEQMPKKDRATTASLIEKKMGQFVQTPENIVYGSAQIYNPNSDEMIRQPLDELLNRMYEDAGTLGEIMNVLDPSQRAANLSTNVREKIFAIRAKIARRIIRIFGWATLSSSAIPAGELIVTPTLLAGMVMTVFKVMGLKISFDHAKELTGSFIKECGLALGASFAAVGAASLILDLFDVFAGVGIVADLVLLSRFKYQRTVTLGEVALEYIHTNGQWGGDGHAAILRCRDRAKENYGRLRKSAA